MSSVKQLLGFPHLHPAAQRPRHEDHTPTSLSDGLSFLSFLHIAPTLSQ